MTHGIKRNRSTGTEVEWGRTSEFDLDDSQGKWATVCVTHSEVLFYETAAVARSYAPHPEEWCSACGEDR